MAVFPKIRLVLTTLLKWWKKVVKNENILPFFIQNEALLGLGLFVAGLL